MTNRIRKKLPLVFSVGVSQEKHVESDSHISLEIVTSARFSELAHTVLQITLFVFTGAFRSAPVKGWGVNDTVVHGNLTTSTITRHSYS